MIQLLAYYGVGFVNTAFGYGLYALLVFAGMNIFLAQMVATVFGVIFNYFGYSRVVFRDRRGSILQFVAAYIGQYLVSLVCLATLSKVTTNPYAAGFGALVVTSLVFYVFLKRWVFRSM